MARTDTLQHFLTDIADSIRAKTGGSGEISADAFDSAIGGIPVGSSNEVTNTTGTVYECDWQDLIIPETRTTVAYLFNGWKYVKTTPKVSFSSTVVTVGMMYNNCTSLEYVDMSGWDISNLIGFSNTFSYCTAFTGTNNLKFPTTTCNGTDVSLNSMFESCTNLVNLDLSALHVNNIRVITNMFKGCSKLKNLDIRNFTFSTTTTDARLTEAFRGCSALEHLDMRGFDFANTQIYNKNNMMMSVPTSCEIIVKDAANKTWFNTNFSTYTNVKTVAEYEAE